MLFFFVEDTCKEFLSYTKCWHGKSGLEIASFTSFDRSKGRQNNRTRSTNTKMEHKTSKTTSIIGVWRNVKQVELNLFGDKECRGIRFGSKSLGEKFYYIQKSIFFFSVDGSNTVIIRPQLRHDYSLPVHRNDRIRKE